MHMNAEWQSRSNTVAAQGVHGICIGDVDACEELGGVSYVCGRPSDFAYPRTWERRVCAL